MTILKQVMLRLAKEQRRDIVNAEALIWNALRNRRLNGFKFRRQVPLGRYIADFACFDARLIVEIDGPSHDDPAQRARDAARDAWLRAQRFRVLRITNDLVLGATELAVQQIAQALATHPSSDPR